MNDYELEKLLDIAYKEKFNDASKHRELTIFTKGELYPKIDYFSLNIITGIFSDKLEVFIKYKTKERYDREVTFTYTNESYINTIREIIHNRNKLYNDKENLIFHQALKNTILDYNG